MKKRGITLKDLENEKIDNEKAKKWFIKGILHGEILNSYEGDTFEKKFSNYVYLSGIVQCQWIKSTNYDVYYQNLSSIIPRITSDSNLQNFVNIFLNANDKSVSQKIMKITSKSRFFEGRSKMDEFFIEEYVDIFKELSALSERYLKLLYGVAHNYSPNQIVVLQKKRFYEIWDDLRNNSEFAIFTNTIPNTVYWNASKHGGVEKVVRSKEIRFKSNEGEEVVSYSNFVSFVRDLYALTIVLIKIKLMIVLSIRTF